MAIDNTTTNQPVPKDIGGKLQDTAAFLVSLSLGIALWIIGGAFTLLSLKFFNIVIDPLTWTRWWFLPLAISILEISFKPNSRQGLFHKWLSVFAPVSILDLGSTVYGMVGFFGGRVLPFFTGIAVPSSGPGLFVPVVIAGTLLTFGPEWLIVSSIKSILLTWDIKVIRLGSWKIKIEG